MESFISTQVIYTHDFEEERFGRTHFYIISRSEFTHLHEMALEPLNIFGFSTATNVT